MSPPRSRAAFDSFNEIAIIRIELRDTDPVIWRDVEVPTSISLKVLHRIVQAAMEWFDYHLWEFTIDKRRYGLPTDEDWGTEPRTDAAKLRLRDVLRPRKTTIDYLYDFGYCWEHRLTVTNIRSGDPILSYPRFIVGERNAPPEDCGGIPGFYQTLDAAADPKHPNHAEAKKWLDDTIQTSSTSCRSNTPSAASRTSATLPRFGSPTRNHRQYALIKSTIRPAARPDGYDKPQVEPSGGPCF